MAGAKGQTRERIFVWVRDRLLEGRPPTVREVQEAFGFRAVQSAKEHLDALVTEGRLLREAGKSRGYALPQVGPRGVPVPLVGRVQAGALQEALEVPEGYVQVQARAAAGRLFALRVRGESMREAAILDGDLVVVRQQATADHGEIVVALVDGEATVKRLRIEKDRVVLQPENDAFEPIVVDPEDLRILGKAIQIHRYLEPVS